MSHIRMRIVLRPYYTPKRESCHIHTCGMTHSYVSQASFVCVTSFKHITHVKHPHVIHAIIKAGSLVSNVIYYSLLLRLIVFTTYCYSGYLIYVIYNSMSLRRTKFTICCYSDCLIIYFIIPNTVESSESTTYCYPD